MRVLRSLNQNALLVRDTDQECIVIGKGIGYGKKKGDKVDKTLVETIYRLTGQKGIPAASDLYEALDPISIEAAELITRKANDRFNKKFTGNFVLTLATHIHYLDGKYKKGIEVPEPFHYELKYLYPDEYKLAEEAITFLANQYHLVLPEAEISFFTLHFVNGQLDDPEFTNIVTFSNILNDIVEQVESNMGVNLDRKTMAFSRFMLHLRYFISRSIDRGTKDKKVAERDFDQLYDMTVKMYPKQFSTILRIRDLLEKEHHMKFNTYENFYLLLHLVRVTDGY